MTPSAVQEHGYIRADKHPKSTRFGRQNPVSEQWNSEAQLREWRKAWADAVNHTLQEHQIDTRIDHRSFADQGRDEQPTIHEGYHARDMEKKSLQSQKKELNFLQPVQYYQISRKITTLTEDIEELLSLKERLISDNYFHNESEIKTSELTLQKQQDFLNKLNLQNENLWNQLTENQKLFQEIKKTVCSEKLEELFDTRADMRETVRNQIYQKLSQTIGQEFDTSLFYDSVRDIDNRLLEYSEAFRTQAFQKQIAKELGFRKDQSSLQKRKIQDYQR